jgi:creatinine amidohydrolase
MFNMKSVWLQENSWEELNLFKDESKGVVIIPVGSTEQHGLHLPLGTDTMVAIALAEDAAKQTNTVVAPPLWFGWSPHHMVLPGTITIRPEVLIEVLYDIIHSLNRHGFKKFILINGHRIVNITWMQIAAERAQRELGVKAVIFDPAYMSQDIVKELGFGPVGHSEEIETSHMLCKYPELVQMEKAKDNPVHSGELYHVDPAIKGDTLCYVPSTEKDMARAVEKAGGTTGEPTKSSAEKGEIYHEHLVKRLVAVINELKK